ncbi:PilZ domain-containing protein [Yoonia sp. I 8.24]|uniref:PilZ domain-containing protein n=1 Tax=Yoonia sp. I 8.24 TaxID=1537229 RepID=UPI001EDDE38A|nr:PilZ domain-containing protein [Yoonia sp. I 8.24]MCG3266416.1 PilZ domain-containing protein [Yoonia sp. I 8.24]
MVRGFRIFIRVIAPVWCVQPAYANCEVIALLDMMHSVEHRISQAENDTNLGVEIQFLSRGIARTSTYDMLAIVGPQNAAAFEGFLDQTQEFLHVFERQSLPTAMTFLKSRNAIRQLNDIANRLPELRCAPPQQILQGPPSDDDGTNLSGVPLNFTLSRDRVLLAVLGLIAFMIATFFAMRWQARNQRRTKRYRIHYQTQYQVNDGKHFGVLLDISGAGIKLQHDPSQPPMLGTKIIVDIGDQRVSGTIQWTNPNFSGILLSPPMHARQVNKFVRTQQSAKTKTAPQRDAV